MDRRNDRRYDEREHRRYEYERDRGGGLDNAGQPNDQLIFQGLDPSATELDLHRALEEKGAAVENVILIRDKDTRLSRCFAFAKFKSVAHAQEFTEKYFPFVYMGMQKVRFAYSRDMKEVDDGWTCANCAVVNYPRRPACFKCGTAKADAGLTQRTDLINDGLRDISSEPSQFVLVRNMDIGATEQLVANAMKKLGIEIKRVLLIRDRSTGQSLGFSFVEYGDVEEAKQAMTKYSQLERFTIKSKAVHLTFCHSGVFVPVYAGDERVFLGSNGVELAYWDDKAYASELLVNPIEIKPDEPVEEKVEQKAVSTKPPVSIASRKMAPHLQKWTHKQQELVSGDSEEYIDTDRIACLLCARQFTHVATLHRHVKESELHRRNLDSSASRTAAAKRIASYRDRARERRKAHRQPEKPRKEPKVEVREKEVREKEEINKGAQLLGKMGWVTGSGLGSSGQGRVEPVEAQHYFAGAGLGAAGAKKAPGFDTYGEYVADVKERAKQRYSQL